MMLCPSQCLMPGGTRSRFALFLVMLTSITSQDSVCQVSPMKLTVYLINSIFREVLYTHLLLLKLHQLGLAPTGASSLNQLLLCAC